MSRPRTPTLLTEQLVLSKARCRELRDVEQLNLWGCWLSDVSVLAQCPNAEVLSLSVNYIASLQPFAYCPRLAELYLRRNLIDDLAQAGYLKALPIRILWLLDNPCASHPLYRAFLVRLLPALEKLDKTDVTPEERAAAAGDASAEMSELLARADQFHRRATAVPAADLLADATLRQLGAGVMVAAGRDSPDGSSPSSGGRPAAPRPGAPHSQSPPSGHLVVEADVPHDLASHAAAAVGWRPSGRRPRSPGPLDGHGREPRSHVLRAVTLLLGELDDEEVSTVMERCSQLLAARRRK